MTSFFIYFIVENKEMVPRRDYADYSKYINDSYSNRK